MSSMRRGSKVITVELQDGDIATESVQVKKSAKSKRNATQAGHSHHDMVGCRTAYSDASHPTDGSDNMSDDISTIHSKDSLKERQRRQNRWSPLKESRKMAWSDVASNGKEFDTVDQEGGMHILSDIESPLLESPLHHPSVQAHNGNPSSSATSYDNTYYVELSDDGNMEALFAGLSDGMKSAEYTLRSWKKQQDETEIKRAEMHSALD